MVQDDLAGRGIQDQRVLDAMARVPREQFVPHALAAEAYADRALDIGAGQTISQPYIVAVMTEAAAVEPTDRVLDVGTGSGYHAAVLALLAASVVSIERLPDLSAAAARRLAALAIQNVRLVVGDGTRGLPDQAPWDAIVVAAAPTTVPYALRHQLADGGRLIIPVGPPDHQRLLRLERRGAGYVERDLGAVRFVPLI